MEFYEMLGQYYDILFPTNERQIACLEKQVKAQSDILDIGCATGGYALEMARRGHHVTAIDLDQSMVEQLKIKSKKEYLSIDMQVMDMRAIDQLAKQYDLIYCIGNTLVHLETLEEVAQFFKSVHAHLKEGGKFVLQTVNYDRVLSARIQHLKTIERPTHNLCFERTYEQTETGLRFIGHLKSGSENLSAKTNLLPILKCDIKKTFISAGFSEFGFYGDFEEGFYNGDSEALVAIATK